MEFLEQYTTGEEYWKMLPPIEDAIDYWEVDPSCVISMYRGILSNINQGIKIKNKPTSSNQHNSTSNATLSNNNAKLILNDTEKDNKAIKKEITEIKEEAEVLQKKPRYEEKSKSKRTIEEASLSEDLEDGKYVKNQKLELKQNEKLNKNVIDLMSDEEDDKTYQNNEHFKYEELSYLDEISSRLRTVDLFKNKKLWDFMTPDFYTLFWSLRLSDLKFPENEYLEIQKRIDVFYF